ncbi:MAG TPA: hypothetical protein VEZ40_20100 [Pyrinomonadaceae bacterium]|nr:hypothetical protein [Pyrinomonadaceae bacterium]
MKKTALGLIGGVITSLIAGVIMIRFDPNVREYFFPPERRLVYSLTVQKIRDGKPYQDPFQSAGQEVFENGYMFRFNMFSSEAGYLYLFNEGKAADGKIYFNILYPTPKRNNGSAHIATGQQVITEENTFGGKPDTEKLWITWTREPHPRLEAAKTSAFANDGKIKDSQVEQNLHSFLQEHSAAAHEVVKDIPNKQTVIIGRGQTVVSLLYLEHR